MSNVVFFVSNLDSGGLENYLLRFLVEKHKQFNNIYIWCKSGCDGQLDDSFNMLGNVELVKEKLGYFSLTPYKRLQEFIYKKEINIVCDFSGNFSGRVMAVAKKAKADKRIAAYRGSSDHFKKGLLRGLYNRWARHLTYKYSTNIVSNSKAGLNYFFPGVWMKDSRFSVIYNGINPEKFIAEQGDLRSELHIPEGAYVIGHTGRFNVAKNHLTILAVAEKMVQKYSDVYFILCGNGVSANLASRLQEKRVDDKILVFENRTDIPRFLNTMDCYFFPSITEGQPNSLIEAMIMGLPIVASDIPPIRETVGSNLSLYPAMDANAFIVALEHNYFARNSRSLDRVNISIKNFDYKIRFNEFYELLAKR